MITDKEKITISHTHRNDLVRKLWLEFRNLSDLIPADDWTEEDLDLWTKVTEHTAIQNRLNKANEKS